MTAPHTLPPSPLPNAYWVHDRFLAAEYPGAPTEPEARRKIGALLDAGLTVFVDLTEADEHTPYGPLGPYEATLHDEALSRGLTARYRRIPIRDVSIPSQAVMREILHTIDRALAEGQGVVVHCRGGIGRTGTVVGCHLVERGLSGADALTRVAERYATVEKARVWPRSPETGEQAAFVRHWTPLPDAASSDSPRP